MDVLPLYIVLLLALPFVLRADAAATGAHGACCFGALYAAPCSATTATCRPIRPGPGTSIRSPGSLSSSSEPGARSAAAITLSRIVRSRIAVGDRDRGSPLLVFLIVLTWYFLCATPC